MMTRTCTVQVNLDFATEADMVKKFRVSLALQPIATALFADSPFTEGKPNGYLSYRSHIWTDTDPDRTGMLDFVFDEGFGFERYVDYLLDVPMYFTYRDGEYIDCAGLSFRDFMAGKLPELPGVLPTMNDWADHMTTAFPEVRLKKYLEMRGADGGPWNRLCALPAFWVGLLYDDEALDAAWDLVKDFTHGRTQCAARRRAEACAEAAVPQGHGARTGAGGAEDFRAGIGAARAAEFNRRDRGGVPGTADRVRVGQRDAGRAQAGLVPWRLEGLGGSRVPGIRLLDGPRIPTLATDPGSWRFNHGGRMLLG